MFSHITRIIQLALKSLMLHRMRSALTMLGIVFGVFSVIAMLAIGEGASDQAQKQVLELGATNIICVSIEPSQQQTSPGREAGFVKRFGLKKDDLTLLESIPVVEKAIPIREKRGKFRFRDQELPSGRLVGCTGDYASVNRLDMAQGRFLSEGDKNDNVCVIAHEVASQLFRVENPVGKAIVVDDTQAFRIIGVTRHRTASAAVGGSLSGQEFNKDIYIPINTMLKRIDNEGLSFERSQGSFSVKQYYYSQITLQVSNSDDVEKVAEVVRDSLGLLESDKNKKRNDVDVVVPKELLKQARQLKNIFNVVLGSIAAISLVVGGIGIMNIMLATVTERTREIGVRRALGAKQGDITTQFLTETIVLAGTGGLIGVILGLLTPYMFFAVRYAVTTWIMTETSIEGSELGRIFSGMEPSIVWWSPFVAFGISVGIGIIFGLYPARAAARLDPIEALRHE